MKLAALPGNTTKHRPSRCLQPLVGIADDPLHATQPTGDQVLEELSPMRFLLAQRDRYTQDGSLAVGLHPHRQQDCRIAHLPVDAHLLVASIKVQIDTAPQRTRAPLLQDGVELGQSAYRERDRAD